MNTETKIFHFSGTSPNVNSLLESLRSMDGVVEVGIMPDVSKKIDLLARKPQGQFELLDLVVGLVINVASNAIYEAIKLKIINKAKEKQVVVQESSKINSKDKEDQDGAR